MPALRLGMPPCDSEVDGVRVWGCRMTRRDRLLRMILMLTAWSVGCAGCDARSEPTSSPASSPAPAAPKLTRLIRVLIESDVPACRIFPAERVDFVDAATGAVLASRAGVESLLFRFDRGAVSIGGRVLGADLTALDVRPAGDEPLEIELSDGVRRRFRGYLRLLQRSESTGAVVNVVDMEDYLVGVVSAELPHPFHIEAFRAQAIVARTYAWYQKQIAGTSRAWDLTATERSQVYPGMEREGKVPRAAEAVRDTAGLVCTWLVHVLQLDLRRDHTVGRRVAERIGDRTACRRRDVRDVQPVARVPLGAGRRRQVAHDPAIA